MNITLDEDQRRLQVESGKKVILDLREYPVRDLKEQLRAWLAIVDDQRAPAFIFTQANSELTGTFRIEPRAAGWQFTSWKELVRSEELLTLGEWRTILQECGV